MRIVDLDIFNLFVLYITRKWITAWSTAKNVRENLLLFEFPSFFRKKTRKKKVTRRKRSKGKKERLCKRIKPNCAHQRFKSAPSSYMIVSCTLSVYICSFEWGDWAFFCVVDGKCYFIYLFEVYYKQKYQYPQCTEM